MLRMRILGERLASLPMRSARLLTRGAPFDLLVLGNGYSLTHLRSFETYSLGPVQRNEALFLYSLAKVVNPKTIVEFGFLLGHSAVNFLRAMPSDGRLFSYDISNSAMQYSRRIHDKRFTFVLKSQAEFDSSDIEGRTVDLAFFDAAHDFDLNVVTMTKLVPSLSPQAIVAVHDTGAWHGDLRGWETPEGYFIDGSPSKGYIHRPGERKFVNWVKQNLDNFDQIHLHSTSELRHGLTLLQRNPSALPL